MTCVCVQVGSKDTLNSIALHFNITPNKLVQLNRLFSRSVVPGQVSPFLHFTSHLLTVLSFRFSFESVPTHSVVPCIMY